MTSYPIGPDVETIDRWGIDDSVVRVIARWLASPEVGMTEHYQRPIPGPWQPRIISTGEMLAMRKGLSVGEIRRIEARKQEQERQIAESARKAKYRGKWQKMRQ